MTPSDEILTLEQVSHLTKYSLSYLRNNYMRLMDRGVRVLRIVPNARPRFYKSDILKLMEGAK